jgi:beta-glucosidase
MDEVYDDDSPGNIKSVLTTFDCSIDAVLDIITGRFTPSGKMPFSTPRSEAAAQHQLSELPGYMEKKGYALFNMNEGMTFNPVDN